MDRAAVDVCRRAVPRANIHHGNALLGTDYSAHASGLAPFRGPYLDWPRTFPEACAAGGFDAVLGNPPWVSLAGRFAPSQVPPAVKTYLARRFAGSAYLPNLFEYFLALALDLTRPGGYFGLVLPDRLAFNRQYTGLRERLLRETSLIAVLYGVPFPGVTADTMILVGRKGRCAAGHRVEIGDLDAHTNFVRQADIAAHVDRRFERAHSTPVQRLLRTMRDPKRTVPLGEICEIASGFGGRSERFTEKRVHARQIPVVKGLSISRYNLGKRFWFDFRKENLTGRTVDVRKLGAAPKILLRKTGNRIIATLDDAGIFPDQSLYLLHRTAVDLRFLLGVLNSAPLTFYLRACCLTNPRSIAQVKKCDLINLPVPKLDLKRRADRKSHDAVVRLVEKRLEADASDVEIDAAIDRAVCSLLGLSEHQWKTVRP